MSMTMALSASLLIITKSIGSSRDLLGSPAPHLTEVFGDGLCDPLQDLPMSTPDHAKADFTKNLYTHVNSVEPLK